MDKLTALFKNVWFRRSVALIGWVYTGFLIWIAWLCFGYYFEFENPVPLFVLYLFVNIVGFGLLIFTRKQVLTQINSYVLLLVVFLILMFGFGKWFIIAPPAAVAVVFFFISRSNETLKTVLGTMCLLMCVIGVVGFIGVRMFMGNITFTLDEDGSFTISELDMSLRDEDYENVSPSGEYRVVRYISSTSARSTVSYYVEYAGDDVNIPLGVCKKVAGCRLIHTATFTDASYNHVVWSTQKVNGVTTEVLLVEGIVRENPYLVKSIDTASSSSGTTYALISTSSSDSSDDSESLSDAE